MKRIDGSQSVFYTKPGNMSSLHGPLPVVANPDIDEVIRACERALKAYYGDRLVGVVLYGSAARGEMTEESDLDLLVLLRPPFDFFAELRRVVDILYPIQLKTTRLISAKPASAEAFEKGKLQLYRNAKADAMSFAR